MLSWSTLFSLQRHRQWSFSGKAIGPGLYVLMVNNIPDINIGQRLKCQPAALLFLPYQAVSACFTIQPRDRSNREAI